MKEYLGNTEQLFDVRQYVYTDGRANGVRAIEVWNGTGLNFVILPDRGLDLGFVRYNNNNMSYITSAGTVDPRFYSYTSDSWLRAFNAGFLTTVGMQNIGSEDENYPNLTMHGRVANTPAENVCVDLADDGMSVKITGRVKETRLFDVRLTLKREYTCRFGDNKIIMKDTITNDGFTRVPVSMLYHFNIGYPLLSEKAKLVIPAVKTEPRNAHAAEGINEWAKILPPQPGFEEMCFYHTLKENCVGIDNPAINTSMRISYTSNGLLDRLLQWRMFGQGDYVTGIEPASCTLEGRTDAVNNGSQKYLDAGASYINEFEISFKEI